MHTIMSALRPSFERLGSLAEPLKSKCTKVPVMGFTEAEAVVPGQIGVRTPNVGLRRFLILTSRVHLTSAKGQSATFDAPHFMSAVLPLADIPGRNVRS